mmetsp:Transcript_31064/g.84892  ORF Transcript_31064/g.84892 Transcript_31064/m.84892 type:complete len:112 (-) Transcript_31064:88-423(-)|eukprot:scaffold193813_cov26-Tisochrysis_lutea.AAC.2
MTIGSDGDGASEIEAAVATVSSDGEEGSAGAAAWAVGAAAGAGLLAAGAVFDGASDGAGAEAALGPDFEEGPSSLPPKVKRGLGKPGVRGGDLIASVGPRLEAISRLSALS